MVGIVMAVWGRVAASVRVLMFVLVEYDLQAPAERISDAAQRLQAWNMIAAFEARDHGFCHPKSLRQLLLSLACMSCEARAGGERIGRRLRCRHSTGSQPLRSRWMRVGGFGQGVRCAFQKVVDRPLLACAVERRRFPVGASPTRQ